MNRHQPWTIETQDFLDKLLALTRPDDSLLLLMYGSPDPDALASAMALREILMQNKGLSRWAFAATEPFRRQQNKKMAQAMRLGVRLINQVNISEYRLIALVDAQPSFFGEPSRYVKPDFVFDHHPRQEGWQAQFADVRPQYGALSTVMTEYLLCAGINIPRNLHTALLYGIKTDTDNFDRQTIAEDIRAYTYHSKHANLQLIRRIEFNQTPVSYLQYFDRAYHVMKHCEGRRTGFLGHVESPDVCVQVADFYLRLIGTSYVAVAGIVNEKMIIVLRSDGCLQDCGALAQGACSLAGQGGGHRGAARVEIPLEILKAHLKGDLSQQSVGLFLDQCLEKSQPVEEHEEEE